MILIAPDKFKGTYTAAEICSLVERTLREAGVTEPVLCRPLSDGGEGAAATLMPHGRKVADGVYEDAGGRRLVVSSEIVGFRAFEGSGLPLMRRSSFALGKAVKRGVPTWIAIGGTAVSDGGAGFLQALGARFYDRYGALISAPLTPELLPAVSSASLSALEGYDITGIVDVKASLTDGPLSALDFAPQKALPGEELDLLPSALNNLRKVIGGVSEWDGAGGGLGYAVASVLKAPCISGAQAAVETLGSGVNWDEVTAVITGEGHVDKQTLIGGKLVDAVYRKALSISESFKDSVGYGHHIPCIILCGIADPGLPYPWILPISRINELPDVLKTAASGAECR